MIAEVVVMVVMVMEREVVVEALVFVATEAVVEEEA